MNEKEYAKHTRRFHKVVEKLKVGDTVRLTNGDGLIIDQVGEFYFRWGKEFVLERVDPSTQLGHYKVRGWSIEIINTKEEDN